MKTLILKCLLIIISVMVSVKVSDSVPSLEEILQKAADYCELLNNASFKYFCQEEVVENIYKPYKFVESTWSPYHKEKNQWTYDYQIIKKGNKVEEKRLLIKENGKEKRVENATLSTKQYGYKFITISPEGLLCKDNQENYFYRIGRLIRENNEEIVILEISPKSSNTSAQIYGKLWVKVKDGTVIKAEYDQKSIRNYQLINQKIQELKYREFTNPQIRIQLEFYVEKDKLNFPSSFNITEVYNVKGKGTFLITTLDVKYINHKFFYVESREGTHSYIKK